MAKKVFTKRYQKSIADGKTSVYFSAAIRRRFWLAMKEHDIQYHYHPNPNDNWIESAWILETFDQLLLKEYGWTELRAYQSKDEFKIVDLEGFMSLGVPRFILDALELFYGQMVRYADAQQPGFYSFQKAINEIFEDTNLPWRMSEGMIFLVDSRFLNEEILSKAHELLNATGFEGAQEEFLNSRSDLANGDTKGAIANANLALESTMKAILKEEKIRPGKLLRKMIDSGIIPEYFDGFLGAFEKILHSVSATRNDEKGVGHGQGKQINDPSSALAKLAIHLAGALIAFLIERHLEVSNKNVRQESIPPELNPDEEIPF